MKNKVKNYFLIHFWKVIFLISIWTIVTAFNITKPVHIDDSEYLQIAQHISKNPLHPMSGTENVYHVINSPIYKSNHPLLVPYLFSPVFSFFGGSEIILHLVISLFTLLSIISIFSTVLTVIPRYAYLISTMFALGPAFLPSQNLMNDVPMVSLWLLFFAVLFQFSAKSKSTKYVFAAITISIASLIKYASLVLLPILLIDIILQKHWRKVWVILIPIITLLAWSIFNYFDYGGIHILNSTQAPYSVGNPINKLVLGLITLGAFTPFSIILLPYLFAKKRRIFFLLAIVGIVKIYASLFWQFSGEPAINSFLRELFFINGILVSFCTLYFSYKRLIKINFNKLTKEDYIHIILVSWFIIPSLFILKFVPFMAARHVLLIIPAIMLLLISYLHPPHISSKWIYTGMLLTVTLGVMLGLADWHQADIYRIYAPKIYNQIRLQQQASKSSSTIWFGGFWDWQWYAQKAGMKQYDPQESQLSPGDYFVMPAILQQQINTKDSPILKKIRLDTFSPTIFTYFRTLTNYPVSPAGFYAVVDPRHLPWTFSTGPVETFAVFQVVSPE